MRPTVQSVNRRVDGLEIRLERVESKVDENTQQIKALDAKVDQRFEKIDQRFEKIDQRFEKIDQRFNTLEAKFDAKIEDYTTRVFRYIDLKTESILSEFRAFRDELRDHSGRITRLELVADSHQFRLENLEKTQRRRAAKSRESPANVPEQADQA